MKVFTVFFREEILSMLNRIIEACNNCGYSTTEVKRAAERLMLELEEYTKRY